MAAEGIEVGKRVGEIAGAVGCGGRDGGGARAGETSYRLKVGAFPFKGSPAHTHTYIYIYI